MDRKALAVVIIFLSSLVVLLLLNLNHPATAPVVSPSANGPTTRPSPATTLSAKINTSNLSVPVNATASPTSEPMAEVAYPPPQERASGPSPSAQASPSESVAMQPWQAMPAWSPMPKASPLGWSDTLMKTG